MAESLTAVLDAVATDVREGRESDLHARIAPVYAALAEGESDERLALFRDATADPDSLLEVGCGVGDRLDRFGADRAVGVDRHPELLRAARRRTDRPVVVGDPERPPVTGGFDAVVGLEHVTAGVGGRRGLADLLSGVGERLAPGGWAAFDAPVEAGALLDDLEGTVAGYRLRRSVAAGRENYAGAEFSVEYELTGPDGDTVEAVEFLSVALFDRKDLRSAAESAGLVDVTVHELPAEASLVVTGRRPEEKA